MQVDYILAAQIYTAAVGLQVGLWDRAKPRANLLCVVGVMVMLVLALMDRAKPRAKLKAHG